MNRIGLIGLPDLAEPLIDAGLQVTSDPDLRRAVQQLNRVVREHGPIPVLLLNSPQVANLIPLIRRQVQLTVLGTAEYPVSAEAEGYTTYQLPGEVGDIVKNAGIDLNPADLSVYLELDSHGLLVDPRDWAHWEPAADAAHAGPVGPSADPAVSGGVAGWERAAELARLQLGQPEPDFDRDDDAADQPDRDVDDLFGAAAHVRSALRGSSRGNRTGLGQVVLTISGSGGVGKSTIALTLAARAAGRGLRAIVVDASPGQGDLGTYLRVAGADLPTMYDAVLAGGDVTKALIGPARLDQARDARVKPLRFALLQAPSDLEARTGRITSATINRMVDDARRVADLIVVDTQIVEVDDPRRMVADLVMPQLGRGGWVVAIAALSSAGMANLIRVMTELQQEGVDPSHVLSMLSRIPPEVSFDHDRMMRAFRELSVHLGTAWMDNDILIAMNSGDVPADAPVLAHVLDTALNRILDLPVIAPVYDPYATVQHEHWWTRWRRRT